MADAAPGTTPQPTSAPTTKVDSAPSAAAITQPAPGPTAPISRTGAPRVDPELAPFLRAENEDDDGYDPYSDRPAPREPLFEADPWA